MGSPPPGTVNGHSRTGTATFNATERTDMDLPFEERVVRSAAGDADIGYLKIGSGPSLVIVPGALGLAMDWSFVAGALGNQVTCYPIDRRGKGRSGLGSGYSVEAEAADVKAVLDAAGPEACLLGHSSGALIALETARRYPVKQLVIYEPPFYFRGPEVDSLMARYNAKLNAQDSDAAIELLSRDELKMTDEQIAFMRSTPVWEILKSLAPTFPAEWEAIWKFDPQVKNYKGLSMPVLFMTGSMTENNPSYPTKELIDLLPNTRKVVIPGQGHMAHLAAPDFIAKEVAAFLLS
jgi:pimeloyl-ACP methyl ester carboxylesterase